MTDRQYRVRIYKAGSTSLSTANVDFDLGVSTLTQAPVVTGARVRLLEGRVEASPFPVTVIDTTSGGITSHLADSQGRLTIINRFAQVQRADAGGAFTAIGGGRVTDVTFSDNLAQAQLMISQEWPTGASSLVFTTNTTHLYPPCADPGGQRAGFFGNPYRYGYATITRCLASSSRAGFRHTARYWRVQFRPDNPPMNQHGWDALAQDNGGFQGFSTAGAFRHARFRVNGTDYPIVTFAEHSVTAGGGTITTFWPAFPGPVLASNDTIQAHITNGAPLTFWVAASSTAFGGTGAKNAVYETDNPFLHMMTAAPSANTPLHIWSAVGSSTGTYPSGTHPMQVLKDMLAGAYSHSTVAYQLPLYSTASFTGANDLRKLPMGRVGFRITAPAPMQDWVQQNLCAPFGVMPTQDVTGAVRFRNFRMPTVSTGFSSGSVFGFTSTNLRAPHPDWRANRNEACTVLNLSFVGYGLSGQNNGTVTDADGADNIRQWPMSTALYHDRMQQIGQYPVSMNYLGRPVQAAAVYPNNVQFGEIGDLVTYLSREVFGRFGDGPVQGTLHALESASTIAPGDTVRVALPTYPNLGSNTRGGSRLVQILSKTYQPDGYDYDYLDLGAWQSPTSHPSITLAASTKHPKNAVKVTVGNVPSSGGCTYYLAQSSGSAPGVTSTLWHPIASKTGGGTFEVNKLPSGKWFWAAAQNRQPGRILSNLQVSSGRVQTTVLSAPTALKDSHIGVSTVTSTWAVGETNYGVQVFVDNSTSANPSTANRYGYFPPNTQVLPISGLDHGHKHKVMIRHYDDYGGVSATLSSAFTTLTTGASPNIILPPPAGLTLISGSTV